MAKEMEGVRKHSLKERVKLKEKSDKKIVKFRIIALSVMGLTWQTSSWCCANFLPPPSDSSQLTKAPRSSSSLQSRP